MSDIHVSEKAIDVFEKTHTNAFLKLEIGESFDICPILLELHYEQAQRRVHPDLWSSEIGKRLATQLSAECTQAYQILRNPEKRAEHLLQLGGHWPLPSFPDLFEETFSWYEAERQPNAHDYNQVHAAFASAWNESDVISAQRAYWWMMALGQIQRSFSR